MAAIKKVYSGTAPIGAKDNNLVIDAAKGASDSPIHAQATRRGGNGKASELAVNSKAVSWGKTKYDAAARAHFTKKTIIMVPKDNMTRGQMLDSGQDRYSWGRGYHYGVNATAQPHYCLQYYSCEPRRISHRTDPAAQLARQ